MSSAKILVVKSLNITPEEELNERLRPFLEQGYRVRSAQTTITAVGEMDWETKGGKLEGIARHIYYVTTVALEIPAPHPSEFRLPG